MKRSYKYKVIDLGSKQELARLNVKNAFRNAQIFVENSWSKFFRKTFMVFYAELTIRFLKIHDHERVVLKKILTKLFMPKFFARTAVLLALK